MELERQEERKSIKNIPSLVGLTLIDNDENYFKNLFNKAHTKNYKKINLDKMNLLFIEWDKYLIEQTNKNRNSLGTIFNR